jgi:hypothetical protein
VREGKKGETKTGKGEGRFAGSNDATLTVKRGCPLPKYFGRDNVRVGWVGLTWKHYDAACTEYMRRLERGNKREKKVHF